VLPSSSYKSHLLWISEQQFILKYC